MATTGEREKVLGSKEVEKICTRQLQTLRRPDASNDKDEDPRRNP